LIDKMLSQEELEKELFPTGKKLENRESRFPGKPVAQPPYPLSGLHDNEPLYRHLIEHMNEGLAIIEMVFDEHGLPLDYVYREVNSTYEQQTGHSREQLVGRSHSGFFSPVEGEYYRPYSRVLSSGQFMRFEEFCSTRNRCFDIRAYPLPRANHLAVITTDITELKQAETASRIKHQREELISHIARRLLTSANPQQVIHEVCKQTIQLLNCDVFINCLFEQNEGRMLLNAWEGLSEEEARKIEATDKSVSLCLNLAGQGSSSMTVNADESLEPNLDLVNSFGIQAYICHPLIMGGRVIGTLSFGSRRRPSFTNEELGLMKAVATHIAITMERTLTNRQLRESEEKYRAMIERKRMESAISRLERLNLIGEMTASISHEIRNPMTAIRGFLQLLGGKKKYSNDRMYFELMIEELDRANAIISEYLSMAKDKRVDLQLKSLDSIVVSLYPMIQSDANRYDMNMRLELGQLPPAPLDPNEIRQLILNIARNGLEAMSPGGTLTIGTTLDEAEMILFVRDEGPGLEPELIEKLGTPFITTKENGTGLGLAVCYSIAARHKARIEFDTGPCGTTFYIKFPMHSGSSLSL